MSSGTSTPPPTPVCAVAGCGGRYIQPLWWGGRGTTLTRTQIGYALRGTRRQATRLETLPQTERHIGQERQLLYCLVLWGVSAQRPRSQCNDLGCAATRPGHLRASERRQRKSRELRRSARSAQSRHAKVARRTSLCAAAPFARALCPGLWTVVRKQRSATAARAPSPTPAPRSIGLARRLLNRCPRPRYPDDMDRVDPRSTPPPS